MTLARKRAYADCRFLMAKAMDLDNRDATRRIELDTGTISRIVLSAAHLLLLSSALWCSRGPSY